MMKKSLLILFFGLLGTSVNAQDKTAKITFRSDMVDYGEIEKGSDGVRVFEFTNTGNAPLLISKVSSTCGCAIPMKPDGPISPGAKGVIQIKYDTHKVGPIRRAITVISNADVPTMVLKVKGEVKDGQVQ